MIEADAALLATIEQVKADLGAVKKEMESAMAEDVGAAQQQDQHAELRFGGRLQSGRRDAQEGYQRSAAKLELESAGCGAGRDQQHCHSDAEKCRQHPAGSDGYLQFDYNRRAVHRKRCLTRKFRAAGFASQEKILTKQ